MNVKRWFIGSALGLVGSLAAMAAQADQPDLAVTSHMSPDRGVRITSDNDGACPVHECPSIDDNGGGDARRSDADASHAGGGTPAPAANRRPHLGWQSLLPGSMQ